RNAVGPRRRRCERNGVVPLQLVLAVAGRERGTDVGQVRGVVALHELRALQRTTGCRVSTALDHREVVAGIRDARQDRDDRHHDHQLDEGKARDCAARSAKTLDHLIHFLGTSRQETRPDEESGLMRTEPVPPEEPPALSSLSISTLSESMPTPRSIEPTALPLFSSTLTDPSPSTSEKSSPTLPTVHALIAMM